MALGDTALRGRTQIGAALTGTTLTPSIPRLYAIADLAACGSVPRWLDHIAQLSAKLPTDIAALQIRASWSATAQRSPTELTSDRPTLLAMARDASGDATRRGISVLLNGSPNERQTLGFDGTHLNESALRTLVASNESTHQVHTFNDLRGAGSGHRTATRAHPTEPKPAIDPNNAPVAASVHSAAAVALAAQSGADFCVFAPVFPPASKPGPGRGLAALHEIAIASQIPVVALGGINVTRARSCMQAGAAGVAAIGDFMTASKTALRNLIESYCAVLRPSPNSPPAFGETR